jgi:hypothetical protein
MSAVNTVFAMDNVVFLVPLAVVLGWLFLSLVLGGLAEADLDIDGDADMDADADGDADASAHGFSSVLSVLGAGHLPLLLWLQIMGLLWGSIGLAANLLGAGLWLSLLAASTMAPIATALLSRALAPLLPKKRESEALSLKGSVGLLGKVTSTRVDGNVGEGAFEGKNGHTVYLPIRTETNHVLGEHSQVVIVDVDETLGLAYVIASEDLALSA